MSKTIKAGETNNMSRFSITEGEQPDNMHDFQPKFAPGAKKSQLCLRGTKASLSSQASNRFQQLKQR